jgi:prevent-host-death family protein
MAEVNIREARSNLRELVDRAAAGEEISLTRRGREVARLTPPKKSPRRLPDLTDFRKRLLAEGAKTTESTIVKMREEERW